MLWRAPWLKARVILLGTASWDTACLAVSYKVTYSLKVNSESPAEYGLGVAVATWLITSYLAGRYSSETERGGGWLRTAADVWQPAVAVLLVFIGHSWLNGIVDAVTRFRGFLIPVVVVTSLASACGGVTAKKILSKSKRYIIVCEEGTMNELRGEVKKSGIADEARYMGIGEFRRLVTEEVPNGTRWVVEGSLLEDNKTTRKLVQLKESGQEIGSLEDWCEKSLQRIPTRLIKERWFVEAEGFRLRPGSINWRTKRLLDIIGALCLLCATAPVILICSFFIWAEDKGPIFYSQVRTGMNNRKFRIWKLRSMSIDAEKEGAKWATTNDPRVTRIGKVIRMSRIDELPQLVGVLKGELSLIGPRPERPEIEAELEIAIDHYNVRHWVRPGLSGWAQVCFPYGASVEDARMKLSYDVYYLRNAGVLLDLLITLKTARMVLLRQGAQPSKQTEKT